MAVKKRMGRPPKQGAKLDIRFPLLLDAETLARLDDLVAQSPGASRAQVIRDLIVEEWRRLRRRIS